MPSLISALKDCEHPAPINDSSHRRPSSLPCTAATAPFLLGNTTPHPPNEQQEPTERDTHTRQDENGVFAGTPLVPVVPTLSQSIEFVHTAECASIKIGERAHLSGSHVATPKIVSLRGGGCDVLPVPELAPYKLFPATMAHPDDAV